MKLSLTHIHLQNFLSYQNGLVVLPIHGMVLLQGPSGSGKTAVMQAIAYAFGFNNIPKNSLTTWGAASGCKVEVIFVYGIYRCTLVRSEDQPTHLTMDSGSGSSTVVKGNNAVKEALVKLFEISPEFLSELTYRPQQEPGSFIRKTDSEKKEFLTEVLGLQKFEAAVDWAQKRLKELEVDLAHYAAATKNHTDAFAAAKAEVERYPKPDVLPQEFFDGILLAEAQLTDAETLAANDRFLLSKAKPAEDTDDIKALRLTLDGLIDMKVAIGNELTALNSPIRKLAGTSGILNGLIQKKQALDAGICSQCDQPWVNQNEVEKTERDIGVQEGKLHEYDEALRRQRDAQKEFKNLEQAIEDVKNQILEKQTVNQEEYRKLDHAVAASRHLTEVKRRDYNAAKHRAELATEKYQSALKLHQNALVRHESSSAALSDAISDHDSVQREIHKEQDFAALAGNQGFLGAIFEEVLLQIAAEANTILAKVPNTAHVAIAFATETTTQSGKTKKSITLNVTVGGNTTSLHAGLSGGMKTVVMLATDLAVAKVVAQRSGLEPNWLILDEPFDGLDSTSREAMLEMLAREAQEKVIIVVDHSVDTSGMFQHILKVTQINGISHIDSTSTVL